MWAVKVKNEERRRVTWPLPCLFNWSVTPQVISDKSRRNLVKTINVLQHLHFLFPSFVNHFSGSFECWKTSLSIHPHEIPLIYCFKQPKIQKKTTRESHKKRGKRQKIVSIHTSSAGRLEPVKKHPIWFWFLMKSGSKRSICRDCLAWSIISCSLTIKENLPPLKELQKFCCEHFCSLCLTEEQLYILNAFVPSKFIVI